MSLPGNTPSDVDPTIDLALAQDVVSPVINTERVENQESSQVIIEPGGTYSSLGSEIPNTSVLQQDPNDDDWRVRLKLAKGSNYLYKKKDGDGPGILYPLVETDGIIFPYTPTINIQYSAEYSNYDLVHSNYRGYFYKGSQVQNVGFTATFTAQDTEEANYMLASLHFLRCCTKMFYGQDNQRGMPPPLVFLYGMGEYHFNGHPCAVTTVFYNLPNDVDYIPAGKEPVGGTNNYVKATQQPKETSQGSSWMSQISRMASSALSKGATQGKSPTPANTPTQFSDPNLVKIYKGKTYCPTKMDITFNLLPVQTREQVSNEFSLQDYASGALLKKGFW